MYQMEKGNKLGVKPAPAKATSLPTGSFCGAHSQGLASTSARLRGKYERYKNDTKF